MCNTVYGCLCTILSHKWRSSFQCLIDGINHHVVLTRTSFHPQGTSHCICDTVFRRVEWVNKSSIRTTLKEDGTVIQQENGGKSRVLRTGKRLKSLMKF